MNDHAAQIERHPEIVVAERVVLLRIEHLEQRRAGIALEAGAQLVDLVEHHHAVARAGLADRLDDVAGQRADIGAPMAADLGFVVHAAEADAHELAAHGARDRLAERRLADAGRADETQDRRLALRRELAHREILDDAPLDLLEAVVVVVEDPPRLGDVDRRLLGQAPRQLDQPVEIGAHHAVFGGRLRHALQPAQLLARLSSTSFGILALVIALSSSAISAALPSSPSPSSRWIAAICSRSSTSRWRSSSAALVCWPISCDSRSTSMRCASRRETRSIRAATSTVSRISCFSAGLRSM